MSIIKVPNISARDFAPILNLDPYQTAFELLESKVEKKHPFFGNKFTEHGNRYENLAIQTFENETGNKVEFSQFKSIHSEYNFITGKLDGITVLDNNDLEEIDYEKSDNSSKKRKRKNVYNKSKKRKKEVCVLEVKCPLKTDRNDPLTLENIPKHYWSQCQVYMNLIDCEYAKYIEYYIKPDEPQENGILYTILIKRDRKWWDESIPKIKIFYEEMKKYCKLGSLDTHPIRISEKEWQKDIGLLN